MYVITDNGIMPKVKTICVESEDITNYENIQNRLVPLIIHRDKFIANYQKSIPIKSRTKYFVTRDYKDKVMSYGEIIPNVDGGVFDEALAMKMYLQRFSCTQETLAEKLNYNQSTISNKIRLLNLSDDVIRLGILNRTNERILRGLLVLPKQYSLNVLNDIIKNNLNCEKAYEYINI